MNSRTKFEKLPSYLGRKLLSFRNSFKLVFSVFPIKNDTSQIEANKGLFIVFFELIVISYLPVLELSGERVFN